MAKPIAATPIFEGEAAKDFFKEFIEAQIITVYCLSFWAGLATVGSKDSGGSLSKPWSLPRSPLVILQMKKAEHSHNVYVGATSYKFLSYPISPFLLILVY